MSKIRDKFVCVAWRKIVSSSNFSHFHGINLIRIVIALNGWGGNMFDIYAHHWPGVVFIDHWHSNTWRKSAEKNEEHLTHVWMLNVRAWLVLVTYLCQKAIKKCYSYSVARIIWDPLETHRYVIVRCQCKQFQCSIYSNMTFIRWRKTQIVNLYSKLIRAQCRILIARDTRNSNVHISTFVELLAKKNILINLLLHF